MKEEYKLRLEDFIPGGIVLYAARNENDEKNMWKIENRELSLTLYNICVPPLALGLTMVGLIKLL